jgi:hypothetical protein
MKESKLYCMTKIAGATVVLMVICAYAQSQNAIVNVAFGEAVPLIPVNTGNLNLDSEIPLFYDCIEEAVENSLSNTEPNYFKEEPTRAEVRGCYEHTIVDSGQ